MILALLLIPPAVWVLWRLARRRRRLGQAPAPLAGYDTGVRHHFRTPGSKLLGPKRGF